MICESLLNLILTIAVGSPSTHTSWGKPLHVPTGCSTVTLTEQPDEPKLEKDLFRRDADVSFCPFTPQFFAKIASYSTLVLVFIKDK